MITLETRGLSTVIARVERRAAAARDLTAPMKLFAKELRAETRRAFENAKSPKGDTWDRLKPSTLARRKSKRAAPSKQAATSLEAALSQSLVAGNLKPLDDTGKLKRSVGYVATKDGFRFFAVSYLRPHVSGGGEDKKHPPKRNPTPFEKVGKRYTLIPRLQTRLLQLVRDHIQLRSR